MSSSNDTLGNISGKMAPKKTVVDLKMLRGVTYFILYSGKLEKLKCKWHTVKEWLCYGQCHTMVILCHRASKNGDSKADVIHKPCI